MSDVVGIEIGRIGAMALNGSIFVLHYFSGYECF
jgi:hypothetical protein